MTATERDWRRRRSAASLLPVARLLGRGTERHALWLRLLVGVTCGSVAVVLKEVLAIGSGGDLGYVPYLAVIGLAAWVAGLSAGAVATAITGFANVFFFTNPGSIVPATFPEAVRFITYLLSGGLVAALIRSLRVERDELSDALREQARLTSAIADRDERLELVLAASRTGIWEIDLATREQAWSDQMYEQLGVRGDDGAPDVASFIAPESRDAVLAAIQAAMAAHTAFEVDVPFDRADGTRTWGHVRGRAFYEGDRAVRLLGTSEDITDRVGLERQRDDLAAQEQRAQEFQRAFIDVLSHELRTPMTTIYGASEMLVRTDGTMDRRTEAELLSDIRDESRRLDGLIENLLVLSRAQRGALEEASEPVDLRRAVATAVGTEAARSPHITIDATVPDALPIASGGDAYVGRVLANLLSNAAKYARPGGHVEVCVEASADEVAIRVLDDGVGIDVDPAQLFELFYRAPSASRHAAGSGVGLFVCARLVEAMGGRIWASPRPAGGAEFGFALPRLDVQGGDDLVDEVGDDQLPAPAPRAEVASAD